MGNSSRRDQANKLELCHDKEGTCVCYDELAWMEHLVDRQPGCPASVSSGSWTKTPAQP